MTEVEARRQLRRLGGRRRRLREAEKELQSDTTKLLKKVNGVIPKTEAAELLELNRSTIYEVYGGKREERKGRAKRKG